jgi:hypothetical protein
MKLSIYIRRRLLGDIITLLILSGIIYLLVNASNENSLNEQTTSEMRLLDDNPPNKLG